MEKRNLLKRIASSVKCSPICISKQTSMYGDLILNGEEILRGKRAMQRERLNQGYAALRVPPGTSNEAVGCTVVRHIKKIFRYRD